MNSSNIPSPLVQNHSMLLLAKTGMRIHEHKLNQDTNLRSKRPHSKKLQRLFSTYWSDFELKYKDKLRPSILNNVQKMIRCHDLSFGYLLHECTTCDNFYLSGLSCHSRFCPSCNQKYREQRTLEVKQKLLNVKHRHFVFSIPKELRRYFRIRRKLLDVLFQVVNDSFVILIQDSKKRKREKWTPGLISFLHTYGRDLKWNPHIHALVAECVFDHFNHRHKFSYFHFNKLRKIYQYHLLNTIGKYLKPRDEKLYNQFVPLAKHLVKKYPDGFYTYGPELEGDLKDNDRLTVKATIDYIARYASHPAIAESRIIKIDDDKRLVTWYYDPHEDDQKLEGDETRQGRQIITESVFDFIARLIVHIPDKGFHLMRYYGFYSNHTLLNIANDQSLYHPSALNHAKMILKWERMLIASFKYSPLICTCGAKMVLNLNDSYLPRNRGKPDG